MSTEKPFESDLQFVADVVRRSRPAEPAAIYFLWAVIIPIGFALPDFAPHYAGWYWLVMAPLGAVVSMWLGWRYNRRQGQVDRREGLRHGGHWVLFGVGFLLVPLPALTGHLPLPAVAPYLLLVVGLAYASAGLYLNRGLLLTGIIMLVGFAGLVSLPLPYLWTATGVVVALALAAAGWQLARSPQP